MALLTNTEVSALLGRPLTSTEEANFDTYIDIAAQRLTDLLCFTPEVQPAQPVAAARTFDSRPGYRTLWVDPLTDITSVTVDGNVSTAWVKKQNDSYQGAWFNVIEFDDPLYGERVEVTATWGYGSKLPNDLAQLVVSLFAIKSTTTAKVKSKNMEDFSVTYSDMSALDTVIDNHLGTLRKYAQCERAIAHGDI